MIFGVAFEAGLSCEGIFPQKDEGIPQFAVFVLLKTEIT